MPSWSSSKLTRISPAQKKESIPPQILLAQEEEIQQLISRFESGELDGQSLADLEILVRTVVFKSGNALVAWLLQKAADRADAPLPAQGRPEAQGPGNNRRSRDLWELPFGAGLLLSRAGKDQGHYPADAALGLEVGYTPALAKLICLEGADEPTCLKAERHLHFYETHEFDSDSGRVLCGAQGRGSTPAIPS